jgi:hypothetical protein
MKLGLGLLTIFIASLSMHRAASAQIPSNVLLRTFLIEVGQEAGTGFTIDIDGRQYLITAKHMVAGDSAEVNVRIKTKAGWGEEDMRVLRCDDPVDVAVLVPRHQLTVTYPLLADTRGLILGQDAFYFGFPRGVDYAVTYENMPTVFGLVRRATIAQLSGPIGKSAQKILLDGFNNKGFSGSPLVFQNNGEWKVAGVISGYLPEYQPVGKTVPLTEGEAVKNGALVGGAHKDDNGQYFRWRDTDEVVQGNSGIGVAWDIGTAVALIRANPVGPPAH